MSQNKVFLIGPGFVGREILDVLLANGYYVTALVRQEAAALDLRQSGAQTVIGGIDDRDIIVHEVVKSDIVIHSAASDHIPSVKAIIQGIEQRAKSGKQTIYNHLSGAALFGDFSNGEYKSEKIYEDDKPEEIDTVPESAPHREINLVILDAKRRLGAHAKFAIMIPPLIYGFNKKYGRHSIQVPTLVRFALRQRYAGHIGKGLSVWSTIHVQDLARAWLIVLQWLQRTDAAEVSKNPYFFFENGQDIAWNDIVTIIGRGLHAAGRIDSANPEVIPEDEYRYLFGSKFTGFVVGSNSRTRANRVRALGWHPQAKSIFESLVEDEIPALLEETTEWNGFPGFT